MNNFTAIGRLTKDPELKYSQNGVAICNFTIAVNRPFKQDETDFIPCTCFKGQAENLATYQGKGNLIGVSGSIQVDNYEKDGQKRTFTKAVVNNVQFLESKKSETREKPQQEEPQQPQGADMSDLDLPFDL